MRNVIGYRYKKKNVVCTTAINKCGDGSRMFNEKTRGTAPEAGSA